LNGTTLLGPATGAVSTAGHAGLWSYQPAGAGSHRFDNFSVTVIGGGQPPAGKVLARRVLPDDPRPSFAKLRTSFCEYGA
jgi:hypothetical protein